MIINLSKKNHIARLEPNKSYIHSRRMDSFNKEMNVRQIIFNLLFKTVIYICRWGKKN